MCNAACSENISVVSGYAAGTDTAAHVAAIENGGNTIFVLAEGILNFSYKKQVKAHLTTQNHVFISQFYPDAQWSVWKCYETKFNNYWVDPKP